VAISSTRAPRQAWRSSCANACRFGVGAGGIVRGVALSGYLRRLRT
jgi:hypothetical protein